MSSQGFTPSWAIAPGQRFRLDLLQNLAALVNDPDNDLHYHLQQGVPTGVLEPIPPGHIWPSKPSAEISSEPLQSFDSNWAGAEEDPDLTWSLLQAELEEGWIEEIPGGIPEAKREVERRPSYREETQTGLRLVMLQSQSKLHTSRNYDLAHDR